MGSFIILIKVVTLISVLLMGTCKADITLDEVEFVHKFEISTDSSPIKINPEGPLNFLRGLIYQKIECMYNKRFFSPEINTEYFVEDNEYTLDIYEDALYIRNRQKDRAYTAQQSTNKMDVYTEKYHNHLIELFPSPNGDITIETRGNQSFVQFLRAETTEKHSLKILAMLLLFSEGVNIPIKVTNSVLKVYETNGKDEIYFEVPMVIPWLNPVEDKVQTFQQKKVKQLINFFQENAANQEVLRMMEDKCSQEEVMSGKFLDSLKFLIQSYIFGFIESAERATEFIQTVHIMTEKYAPKTETPSKDDFVYDRLFKSAGTEAGSDCIALVREVEHIMNMQKAFPFTDSTQIPAYISVPMYSRKTNSFSTNYLQDYSNCVECMILSLFCCMAYDPVEGIYRTDHMGDVSSSLEEFFAPKENKSFDTTKAKFQRNWCTVVSDLDEPSIAYCKGRNELDCGLINMLMVIAEVVNAPREEKDKILGFAQSLKEQKGVLKNELHGRIEKFTEVLFKRLSKTEGVQVLFAKIRSMECNGGRYDISGDITITFEHSSIKNTIVLSISNRHSTVNKKAAAMEFKDIRVEKMNEMEIICRNRKTFIENLFSIYAGYEARKINTPKNNEKFLKTQIRKTIENNYAEINSLLLIKKMNDLTYKRDFVSCFIIYSMKKNLYPEHPVIRLVSNILGSSELGNWNTQWLLLPSIFFAGLNNTNGSNLNFPNIKLSGRRCNALGMRSNNKYFCNYIMDCDLNIFIRWINYHTKLLINLHDIYLHPLLDSTANRVIYKYIFRDENMEYSNIINREILQTPCERKSELIAYMRYVITVYLCIEENPNIELIKRNFYIACDTKYISEKWIVFVESTLPFEKVINKLNNLKDQICRNENDINKLNRMIKDLKSLC
ncbi:hypothetical protein NEAUS05_2016 [Nematocida ausubeli]|nr:hypothetical protein NEAUS05_2016 [Nematocida ausubeli]